MSLDFNITMVTGEPDDDLRWVYFACGCRLSIATQTYGYRANARSFVCRSVRVCGDRHAQQLMRHIEEADQRALLAIVPFNATISWERPL